MQFTIPIMLGAAGLAMAAPSHSVIPRGAGKASCGLGNYKDVTKSPIEEGIESLEGKGHEEITSLASGKCVVLFGTYGTVAKLCQDGSRVTTYHAEELAAAVKGLYETCSAELQYGEAKDTVVHAMQLWQDDGSNILIQGDSKYDWKDPSKHKSST